MIVEDQIRNDTAFVASASSLHCVVNIVAAYVGHNSLRAADLPELIGSVHNAINRLSAPIMAAPPPPAADNPAIAVKKSVTRDYIVCLEDGKKFKSLRRHLSSFHNLTPDAYRAKWNLGSDYPMVAPAYSATRSQLARESGLGQVARTSPPLETASDHGADHGPDHGLDAGSEEAPKKPGRGRPRKVPAPSA